MLVALQENYNSAVARAVGRGLAILVREVETLFEGSIATVNVDTKLFRNMAYSQNYMSYYKALALGLRKIAEERYHAHRGAVDEKIHPGYRAEIVNAALSVNGAGLTNYGLITLELQNAAIEDRASVMRENAFDFYERNDLGQRDAAECPDGVRLGSTVPSWASLRSLPILHQPQRKMTCRVWFFFPVQVGKMIVIWKYTFSVSFPGSH
jgi:hypothetical protein